MRKAARGSIIRGGREKGNNGRGCIIRGGREKGNNGRGCIIRGGREKGNTMEGGASLEGVGRRVIMDMWREQCHQRG